MWITFSLSRAGKRIAALALASFVMLQPGYGQQERPADRDRDRGARRESYLPLSPGFKWVLRSPASEKPMVFEVLREDQSGFRLRSTTPWGSSEWTLVEDHGVFLMAAYGAEGRVMPLPNRPAYVDFTRAAGEKWSNGLGEMSILSRDASVASATREYRDCVVFRHTAGKTQLVYTFARGVGYVQFGEGKSAFVLDESSSNLRGAGRSSDVSGRPVPVEEPAPARAQAEPVSLSRSRNRPLFGITPNKFANEPMTVATMTQRFHQTLEAGAGFLVVNGKWSELEPRQGRYEFGSLNTTLAAADEGRLPVSFTLRLIDTIARDEPSDLRGRRWSDGRLQERLLGLIDALAPLLKGRARWFIFGYEIDGYLAKHRDEQRDFVELYRLASERIRQQIPGIQVGSTIMYAGLDMLTGPLADLNRQLDFVSLTYCPMGPDFTVQEPTVLPGDFRHMKQIAAGRQLVFQEIAFPTSPATRSNQEKQAEFYRLAFGEFARDPGAFGAINFMTLADLSDEQGGQYAAYYGQRHNEAFKGTLQSLGMFDAHGQPKKSWFVLRENLRR